MGTKDRRRRATKQRRRHHEGQRDWRSGTTADVGGDPTATVAALVWDAARAVADGHPQAGELVALLEVGMRLSAGTEMVVRSLDDAVAQQTSRAERDGWTADDLDAVGARRLRAPAASSPIARSVHRLAVLLDLPSLPPVAPPVSSVPGADVAMLAKVRALLVKAESTTFPEEAEALTAKAQELMARHRIDRAAVAGAATGGRPVGRRIWIDDPHVNAKARLLTEVAAANRCRSVQLVGLGCSHVVGFPGDLAVVDLLHTSLLVQATAAMAAAGRHTDATGRSRTRSFRSSFLVAFAWRIGQRLREVSTEAEADGVTEHGTGFLPVLARRDAEVETAVDAAFPALTRRAAPTVDPRGWAAGTVAADLADLSAGARVGPGA